MSSHHDFIIQYVWLSSRIIGLFHFETNFLSENPKITITNHQEKHKEFKPPNTSAHNLE